MNDQLTNVGVPTWNMGSYPVRPIISAGFLLSLLLMGFRGLLFSGALFFIVNYSGSSGSSGFQMPDLSRFTGGASNAQQPPTQRRNNLQSSSQPRQPQEKSTKTKAFSGPGYKLE